MLTHAMLFAAGLGTRMRPLTDQTPKALIELDGKPLLEHALARFEAFGVARVVVNTHHLAEPIAAYLARRRSRMEVVRSHEDVLLETGGGVMKARALLGDAPFFCANMDTLWLDGPTPALDRLRDAYDPARMDTLLLLQPRERTVGFAAPGDFGLTNAGVLTRGEARPYVAAGLYVVHPRALAAREVERFSMAEVWLATQQADGSLPGRYGLVHDDDWLHVGTPAELAAASAFLAARRTA